MPPSGIKSGSQKVRLAKEVRQAGPPCAAHCPTGAQRSGGGGQCGTCHTRCRAGQRSGGAQCTVGRYNINSAVEQLNEEGELHLPVHFRSQDTSCWDFDIRESRLIVAVDQWNSVKYYPLFSRSPETRGIFQPSVFSEALSQGTGRGAGGSRGEFPLTGPVWISRRTGFG